MCLTQRIDSRFMCMTDILRPTMFVLFLLKVGFFYFFCLIAQHMRIQSKAASGTVVLWLAGLTVSRSWVQIHWFPGIFLYEYSGLLPKMHLDLVKNQL